MANTKTSAKNIIVTEQQHKGKALEGKSGKGAAFNPAAVERSAMGAALELDRPRPSPTRYPIDMKTFERLKEQARTSKIGKVAKKGSTIITDKARRKPAMLAESLLAEDIGAPLTPAPFAAAPPLLSNFPGISATKWTPPDCTLAAGPNHVLVAVNTTVSIYSKAGGAAALTKSLTDWFSNVISGAKLFDPTTVYDQYAGRWVLLCAAVSTNMTESYFLLAISKTSDPLGEWWNYKIDATRDGAVQSFNWADYPSLGVDAEALYVTANMFRFDNEFAYAKIRVIPKDGPYSGGAVKFKDFVKMKNIDGTFAFTIQPSHTYGAPGAQYMVSSFFPEGDQLSLWTITNPTGAAKLTMKSITVSPYSLPPHATQKGGGTTMLETGDVRVLNAVFRGGSVWCAITTNHDFGGGNVAAIHWFQINPATGTLTQQGIYGSDGLYYSFPAVAPDSNGNMTMVFSRCGANEFVSIYYTGRKAADPPGSLQGSALLKAGIANFTKLDGSDKNRWGDYAGISSDPADSLRIWFYSMYAEAKNAQGESVWGTQIGSSKF